MAKVKEQTSFLKKALESLTQEGFDEAVRIFQKYWLKNEIVDVNGTNDGGCDIKIYKSKRELKKCVQVTVRKDWENKLKIELKNANNLITKYGYSDKYDFFCSSVISDEKVNEYKKYALEEYDIDLTIYEANRLSQIECPKLKNYLYSLHDDVIIKPNQLNLDKVTKSIYDLLTVGKGTTDIKNDLLNSLIISILYEKESMTIVSLKSELEKRLNKTLPDITHTINLLKTARRVVKDPDNSEKIKLSESEFSTAKDIFAYASLVEQEFITNFKSILTKYNITKEDEVLDHLKSLYRSYYKNDIDDSFNTSNNKEEDIFKSFNKYLNTIISDESLRVSFICEIKQLCEDNTYLNRISASESFLSLYKSDKLEQYVNHSQKSIYVDTPVLVYMLCATFQIGNIVDWKDSLYRSVKSLYDLQSINPEKLHFNIMLDYIGEVAGELKKAYQISQLEDAPFFSNLGNTRNTFYNYYRHLKDNDLIDVDNEMESFVDFLGAFGIDEYVFLNNEEKSLTRKLREIIEDMEIEIKSCPLLDDFNNAKTEYEKQLYDKSKSDYAITHDVRQILYLLNADNYENEIFITWDMSLPKFRDKLMSNNTRFKYFPIYNPAKLSNKIALESFNINSSAITNDIFIYADRTFSISNKVKSLLEIIAPIYDSKDAKNNKVLKSLGEIRKQQKDSLDYNESELSTQNLPIEEVFIKMLELVDNKEKECPKNNMSKKFKAFMIDQNNETYIINVVKQGSEDFVKNKKLNLDDFFEKVSKVEIK